MCYACDQAREAPEHARLFADGCLHCAARYIQHIQRRMSIAPSAKADRCRKVLAQALTFGLSEMDIRRMAKLPEWQLAPLKSKEKTK